MAGADALRAAVIGDDMTEDELLAGVIDALYLGAWTWTHIRRSDGITVGHTGLPDIIAVGHVDGGRRTVVLAWELKTTRGQLSPDQLRWHLAFGFAEGVDARIIRPADYDRALEVLIRKRDPRDVWPEA